MTPESPMSESPVSETPVPQVWVIVNVNDEDEVELFEAHVSEDSAAAASKRYHSVGYAVQVKMIDLRSDAEIDTSAKKGKSSSKKKSKKAKNAETEDEEGESEPEGASSPKRNGKSSSRKSIPEIPDAKPNALKGLRLLFLGTMQTDRKTLEATAAVHGGLAIRKVEHSDYVVVGTRPSAPKLEAINKHGVEQITETEFFDLIRTGVPAEKRERIKAGEADEQPKKKQKK